MMAKNEKKMLEFERDMQYVVVVAEIAKALIQYREEHNLTQVELAEILEINQVMVSKLESGEYNPTFKKLFYISWKLTNSADFFVNVLNNIEVGLKRHSNQKIENINPIKSLNDIKKRCFKKPKQDLKEM